MSFSSQRTLASLVARVGLLAAYTVYAVSTGLVWSSDVKRVAVAMLVFIGIGVGAAILVQIGFHVFAAIRAAVREGGGDGDQERIDRLIASEMVEDEMQKLVAWKASRAAAVGAGVGIIALLVTLACGGGTALGLHLMLWCCGAGSLAEGVMAIWFHQRGVRNG